MSTVPSPSHSFLFFSMNSSPVSVNTISYFGYINVAQNLENKTNYFKCKHFCGFLSYFLSLFFLVTVVSLQIYFCMFVTWFVHTCHIHFLPHSLFSGKCPFPSSQCPVYFLPSCLYEISSKIEIISLSLYNPFDINKYQ